MALPDYSTDPASPGGFSNSVFGGMQQGLTLRNNRDQVDANEANQKLALAAKQQQIADVNAYFQNPNPTGADTAKLILRNPALAEPATKAYGLMAPDQQQAKLTEASTIYSALSAGRPDIAQDNVDKQIVAAKNSGASPAAIAQLQTLSDIISQNPKQALGIAGIHLASIMGPEKFTAAFGGTQAAEKQAATLPGETRKTNADASIAETTAGVKSATAPADIQKPFEDNLSIQQKRDIDALDVQIRAANSETERAALQLKRDKLANTNQQQNQTQGQDSQNQLDNIGNSLSTIASLKDDPLLNSSIGVGSMTGKLLSMIPGTDNKDFRARVDTLKSQQFLTAAKELKGMGALSDAEGARIERAIASLDTDQSVPAFKNALGVIETTLRRAQGKILASGKTPTTGGAFVLNSPKFGNINEGDINKLLVQNPGSTREQVMQFLQQNGGR